MSVRTVAILGVAAGLSALAPAAFAGTPTSSGNPIFGNAVVKPLTVTENKAVVGKGYYADLYGYYGNYYSTYAIQSGYAGYYFQNYSDYYNAYIYASYASNYYYYAYVNQYYGT